MAVWYEVEQSKQGIKDFMECNWSFHDFRIERVSFLPGKNCVELFLLYDTRKEGMLLRFLNPRGMNVAVDVDYEASWLFGASLMMEDNSLVWIAADCIDGDNEYLEDMKKHLTWVQADALVWAVTDCYGNPVECPVTRLDQIWNMYGEKTEKHFRFKEYVHDETL